MAVKSIADIIYHDEFQKYLRLEVLKGSKLIQAGVVTPDERITNLVNAAGFGGTTIDLPFWNDLDPSDADEIQKNGEDIGLSHLEAGQDRCAIIRRAKGWEEADFEDILAGDDPMEALKARISPYLTARRDVAGASVLAGVFAASTMSNLINDVSSETGAAGKVSLKTVMDTAQLMGDDKGKFTTLYMNSATATMLNKEYGISQLAAAATTPNALLMFNGYRVVVDDAIPVNTTSGVTSVYLFAPGAIALTNVPQKKPLEEAREAGKSVSRIYARDSYIWHVRGIKWKGTAAGKWPTNAELATGTNWERVYPERILRAVKLVAKID